MAKARPPTKKTHCPASRRGNGSSAFSQREKDPRPVKILGLRGFFVVSGTVEQRIASIARLQRGRLTRRQLLAAGIGAGVIDGMLKRGLLRSEHAGVYAVLDVGPIPLSRETAALLACGEGAVLSHRSAAALWELVPANVGTVVMTVTGSERGRKRPGIEVHRANKLNVRDVRIHEQLPVTSPARTILDFAVTARPREVEKALDEALVVLRIVRKPELEDVLQRSPNHPGGPLLKRLLADRDGASSTQSEAEEMFLELIREAGLPLPQTQVPIAGYTVDFFWPEQRVAFEIDGYRFHTSRSAFDRDREKDAAMKAERVDPNRVSRDQVMRQPLTVVSYVAAALARATGWIEPPAAPPRAPGT